MVALMAARLDTVLHLAMIAATFALYFVIGWWTLALPLNYCAGALAMGVYAKVPLR